MATQVQLRRGTDSQHNTFTGAAGEVTVNTDNDSVHVHDGATAGGFELARSDGSNMPFGAAGKLNGISPITASDTIISFNESPTQLGSTGIFFTNTGKFSATIDKKTDSSTLLVFWAYHYRVGSSGQPHSILVWNSPSVFQNVGFDLGRFNQLETSADLPSYASGVNAFTGLTAGAQTFNVAATRDDSNNFSGVLNSETSNDQVDPFTSYIYIMEVES